MALPDAPRGSGRVGPGSGVGSGERRAGRRRARPAAAPRGRREGGRRLPRAGPDVHPPRLHGQGHGAGLRLPVPRQPLRDRGRRPEGPRSRARSAVSASTGETVSSGSRALEGRRSHATERAMLKELVKHLFPRLVREGDLRITYTFCLGGLAFTSLLVLTGTGLLLLFYYSPAPQTAHASIQFLETQRVGRGLPAQPPPAVLTRPPRPGGPAHPAGDPHRGLPPPEAG